MTNIRTYFYMCSVAPHSKEDGGSGGDASQGSGERAVVDAVVAVDELLLFISDCDTHNLILEGGLE